MPFVWFRSISLRLFDRFASLQAALLLLQPDPKASHAEVSIALDGVSHKVDFGRRFVYAKSVSLKGTRRSSRMLPGFSTRGLLWSNVVSSCS